MHEMAITSNIVDVVVKYAENNDAEEVVSVNLVIGELRDIVDELMESCFRYLARGTVAENATVSITKVPLKARCKECHVVFPADLHKPETLVCPDCGSKDLSIFTGKEFLIEGIEIKQRKG